MLFAVSLNFIPENTVHRVALFGRTFMIKTPGTLVEKVIPENADEEGINPNFLLAGDVPYKILNTYVNGRNEVWYDLLSLHPGLPAFTNIKDCFLREIKISRREYKVGDIVRIRKKCANYLSQLERLIGPGRHGGHAGFNTMMERQCGKKAVVRVILEHSGFIKLTNLDGTDNHYSWRDFWLVPKRIKK